MHSYGITVPAEDLSIINRSTRQQKRTRSLVGAHKVDRVPTPNREAILSRNSLSVEELVAFETVPEQVAVRRRENVAEDEDHHCNTQTHARIRENFVHDVLLTQRHLYSFNNSTLY